MKEIIAFVALAGLLIACTNSTIVEPQNQKTMNTNLQKDTDQAAIQQLMLRLFESVDHRDWAAIKSTMANEVYTDYTALGGEAALKTADEIIEGWKGLLPGFERTIHQAHNFAVWVAGQRATATLDAIAIHYLQANEGENYWTVFVGYDTEFVKTEEGWKLARMDLSLYDQTGNPTLPAQVMENVKQNQIPVFQSPGRAKESVEGFFEALEATNLEAFLAQLTDDIVQELPFAPDGFPEKLEGKEALRNQYQGVMDYDQRYERTYFQTMNPNEILVKFKGLITTEQGKPYNNYYIGLFEVNEEGKIKRFVEHFNPYILLNSWTGLQPVSYSVHGSGAKRSGGVKMERVHFESNGIVLKGHLFLPPGFDDTQSYPSAIVTGSWTSVKEQMPDTYASLLAEKGLVTLTFDFTGFGESEGMPRQVEDGQLKIRDIKSAVDFMSTYQYVDPSQITGLGICASAGYMAHAAAQDLRISRLVLVAPWLHNPEIAKAIYDLRPGGTAGLLAAAKAAKEKYAATGEMDYVLAASELDPLSAMYVPENAFDYYLNPAKAAGHQYDNRFAVSSWEPWLTFDGISSAAAITQPVFIVHTESGAVPQGAKAFYEQLNTEKNIVWLNQFNQQQLYFEKEAVDGAIAQVLKHLNSIIK